MVAPRARGCTHIDLQHENADVDHSADGPARPCGDASRDCGDQGIEAVVLCPACAGMGLQPGAITNASRKLRRTREDEPVISATHRSWGPTALRSCPTR